MAPYSLLFSLWNTVLVHSIYTEFDYNYTSSVCSVQECQSCCYSECTEYEEITTAAAETLIAGGECFENQPTCDPSEWAWPSAYYGAGSSCRCPVCTCDVLNEIQYVTKQDGSSHYCYACNCEDLSTYSYGNGSTGLRGWQCGYSYISYEFNIADPSAFQCPPPICTAANGQIYYEGDTWFDESNPASYCQCQSDSTALCSDTYGGILSDSVLLEAFMNQCGRHLRGSCASDVSLWFDPNYYGDHCPRCACDDVAYFTETDAYSDNKCYECECILFDEPNRNGSDCGYSPVYSLTDSELESTNWKCPPAQCDDNGVTKWEGDNWWVTSSVDSTCQTFCVCASDGTVVCSATFAEIATNAALADAFEDSCGYWIPDSCKADASRWVPDPTDYDCQCPVCGCPEGYSDPTAEWYGGWTDEEELAEGGAANPFDFFQIGSQGAFHCDICHCVDGETDCDSAVTADWDITPHCNEAAITRCYEGDVASTVNNINTLPEGIDIGYCEPNQDYCSVTHDGTDFSETSDNDYGCAQPFLCDVLGLTDGGCAVAQYSQKMYYFDYGPDGVHCEMKEYPAIPQTEYTSCCTGDHCNDYTLSSSTNCASNTLWNEYAANVKQCEVGSQAYWRSYGVMIYAFIGAFGGEVCTVDESIMSQEVCDFVRDWVETTYLCPCAAYSTLYNAPQATETIKGKISSYIESDLHTGWVDELNTDHGCGLIISCDITTGVATMTDTDYTLQFDVTVNCYGGSCDTAAAYMQTVYASQNLSVPLDEITVSSCGVSSQTLSMSVDTTFGGTVVRQGVMDAFNGDLLDWQVAEGCSATVSNVVTGETTTSQEQFDGPKNEAIIPAEPTAPTTRQPTTAQPTTKEPTTSEPTTSPPTTPEPTDATSAPTTAEPTDATALPTTSEPTDATSAPTTGEPTTAEPTTAEPTTADPTPAHGSDPAGGVVRYGVYGIGTMILAICVTLL